MLVSVFGFNKRDVTAGGKAHSEHSDCQAGLWEMQ